MKVDLHPCFILHKRAYRETSLLLEVFSLEHGRVSLVARGAKRGKSNQAGMLQPARKLNIAWAMRTEMGSLNTVELSGPAYALSGRKLFCCFYLNELLMRMLHKHESHPELFHKYEQALIELQSDEAEDRCLRMFEKHLLKSLGYGILLDQDSVTGAGIEAHQQYYYLTGSGPQQDKPENQPAVVIAGSSLLALEQENNWNEQIAREAKRLFRAILDSHIGDRPLASRALYRSYLQTSQADD